MNNTTRATLMKICGIALVTSGVIGFYYVMDGGSSVEPKDVLITIISLSGGLFFMWLGFNPDKITPKN